MNKRRVQYLLEILRERRQVCHLPFDEKKEVFDIVKKRFPALDWHEFAADLGEIARLLEVAGEEAGHVWDKKLTEGQASEKIKSRCPGLDDRFYRELLGEALFETR